MVRSFISCLRMAHYLPTISTSAPPCGGIGVEDWDAALASIFVEVCGQTDDAKRFLLLAAKAEWFRRQAVVIERGDAGNEALRAELFACADLLSQWQADLVADAQTGKAA